jgi:hypothetical protein
MLPFFETFARMIFCPYPASPKAPTVGKIVLIRSFITYKLPHSVRFELLCTGRTVCRFCRSKNRSKNKISIRAKVSFIDLNC